MAYIEDIGRVKEVRAARVDVTNDELIRYHGQLEIRKKYIRRHGHKRVGE